jgi:hypothetical protein
MIPVGHRISPDAARSLRTVRVHDFEHSRKLEPCELKLSRTVLRGGTNRNVGPLLDLRRAGSYMRAGGFAISCGTASRFATFTRLRPLIFAP